MLLIKRLEFSRLGLTSTVYVTQRTAEVSRIPYVEEVPRSNIIAKALCFYVSEIMIKGLPSANLAIYDKIRVHFTVSYSSSNFRLLFRTLTPWSLENMADPTYQGDTKFSKMALMGITTTRSRIPLDSQIALGLGQSCQ